MQELLRSHRWPAFHEGRCGNRPNPPIPTGDVRPTGVVTREPAGLDVIGLPPVAAPGSPISPVGVSSAAPSTSQTIVLSSDREEAAQEEMELTVPASPPRTVAPRQVPSHTQVAKAVTNMVTQIRKTGATASTVTSAQRDSQASGSSMTDPPTTRIPRVSAAESNPLRTSGSSHSCTSHKDRPRQSRQSVFPSDIATVRWTAPGAKSHWKTEEPESLAAMESSVRQVARGFSDLTLEGVIQYVESCRARLNEDLRWCTQELRDACGSSAIPAHQGQPVT